MKPREFNTLRGLARRIKSGIHYRETESLESIPEGYVGNVSGYIEIKLVVFSRH